MKFKFLVSPSAQKTINALEIKAAIPSIDKARMPSIKRIHELLNELKIEHDFDTTVNVVEYRSAGRRYVNSRHDGKEGYKIVIDGKDAFEKYGVYYLELDTSESYYSWNTDQYARELMKIIKYVNENQNN